MKLSEFTDRLWNQISKEEKILELPVMKATVVIQLKSGKDITIEQWEFTSKEVENGKSTGTNDSL